MVDLSSSSMSKPVPLQASLASHAAWNGGSRTNDADAVLLLVPNVFKLPTHAEWPMLSLHVLRTKSARSFRSCIFFHLLHVSVPSAISIFSHAEVPRNVRLSSAALTVFFEILSKSASHFVPSSPVASRCSPKMKAKRSPSLALSSFHSSP